MSYPRMSGDLQKLAANPSILKIEQNLFNAKQKVLDCLNPEEKETFLSSEANFTTKLELYKAIRSLSTSLYRICMRYSHSLELLALTESDLSQTFREYSSKCHPSMIQLVSDTSRLFACCSSQRNMVRMPINSLMEEVRTFQTKAISDTMLTIKRMQNARSSYKASLLWMQTISDSLDPENKSRLEKFRKVQSSVRQSMKRYEQLKSDVMEKINMLCASRCSMFSNALSEYCKALNEFYVKTSVYCKPIMESGPVDFKFEVIEGLNDLTDDCIQEPYQEQSPSFSLLNLNESDNKHANKTESIPTPNVDDISDLCIGPSDSKVSPEDDDDKQKDVNNSNLLLGDISRIRPSQLLFGQGMKQLEDRSSDAKKTQWDEWLNDLGSLEPDSDLGKVFGKRKEQQTF